MDGRQAKGLNIPLYSRNEFNTLPSVIQTKVKTIHGGVPSNIIDSFIIIIKFRIVEKHRNIVIKSIRSDAWLPDC